MYAHAIAWEWKFEKAGHKYSELEKKYEEHLKQRNDNHRTELVLGSGVFVRNSELKAIELTCGHDMRKLARALQSHLFTHAELKGSVLLGKGTSKTETGEARPPLNARKVDTITGKCTYMIDLD